MPQKKGTTILIPKSDMIDIKKFLPKHEYQFITKIGQYSDEFGINTYLVGGFVRDLILGRKNTDIDIVVEGDGIEFTKFLANKFKTAFKCFENFTTGKIFFGNKYNIDITSARRESYKYPAALPDVEFADLKQDLYRRDFTINAMAILINKKKFGLFIDPFNGYVDLKNKIIKVLHDKSFIDDPIRILRAIRFEQRFNFKIESKTLKILKNSLKIDIFNNVSGERLTDEFLRIFKEKNIFKILKRAEELGILKKINDKIIINDKTYKMLENFNQLKIKPYLNDIDKNCIFFMIVINSLDIKNTKKFVKRFKLKNDYKKPILQAKNNLKIIGLKLKFLHKNKGNLYFLLKNCFIEELVYYMLYFNNKRINKLIRLFLLKLKHTKINITGDDLIQLGLKPGSIFKKLLDNIIVAKINGIIKNKQQEIEYARNILDKINRGNL